MGRRSILRSTIVGWVLVANAACTDAGESATGTGGVAASAGVGGSAGVAASGGSLAGAGVGAAGASSGGASSGGATSAGATSAGTTGAGTAGQEETGGMAGVAGDATNGGGGSGGSGGTTGGAGGASAAGGTSGSSTGGAANAGSAGTAGAGASEHFSFFVTSFAGINALAAEFGAGSMGFGGDLRYGEATGLAGADKICRTLAGRSLPGAEAKEWRAFLSTIQGGDNDGPVHAIDRVGEGPWYDRLGRLVALTKTDLLGERPIGADPLIINDLPNEDGIPNEKDGAPDCSGRDCPDNHDTMTGTGPDGHLYSTEAVRTCYDWTSSVGEARAGGAGANGPWCGHSWPGDVSGRNWMSALAEGGCAPGSNLEHGGGPQQGVYTVGTGGGYGGIYCFALTP